jgi:hypothetical protein
MNAKILFAAVAIIAALAVTAIGSFAVVTAPALAQDNATGGNATGGGGMAPPGGGMAPPAP